MQVRVLVDVADLIFRSGRPYYYDRGYYQPVVVEYDRWHRPVYYRYGPPPPPHYRVSYDDRRHYDRDRHHHGHHGKKGRGHDRHRGRGWDD